MTRSRTRDPLPAGLLLALRRLQAAYYAAPLSISDPEHVKAFRVVQQFDLLERPTMKMIRNVVESVVVEGR